ncbi:MAG: TolC family protein, partial [Haliscomenobacter sp.]
VLGVLPGTAQRASISLDSCLVLAKGHYPLIRQRGVILRTSEVMRQSYEEGWLPRLSFSVQGAYQSEVVRFDFPGVNAQFPHDSYLASLGAEQTLFDGGLIRQQQEVERISAQVEVQKTEVELYKLVDRVTQLYGNILLQRENGKMLQIFKSSLESRRQNLRSAERNGMALSTSVEELEVEILKAEQSMIESAENLKALCGTLSFLIGEAVDPETLFLEAPLGGTLNESGAILRPETRLFDLQEQLIDTRYQLTNLAIKPRISMSVAGNFGRPGPNFINQNLRFFGSAALNLRWNMAALYGVNREAARYALQKEALDVQKETFVFNTTSVLDNQKAQLHSLEAIVEKDKAIVEKRRLVSQTAASQLEHGKINVAAYVYQLNEEMAARLNQRIHELRLMNMISGYNATKGIPGF